MTVAGVLHFLDRGDLAVFDPDGRSSGEWGQTRTVFPVETASRVSRSGDGASPVSTGRARLLISPESCHDLEVQILLLLALQALGGRERLLGEARR